MRLRSSFVAARQSWAIRPSSPLRESTLASLVHATAYVTKGSCATGQFNHVRVTLGHVRVTKKEIAPTSVPNIPNSHVCACTSEFDLHCDTGTVRGKSGCTESVLNMGSHSGVPHVVQRKMWTILLQRTCHPL
jgi:hypothetical protein